jgi:hypothetical protein
MLQSRKRRRTLLTFGAFFVGGAVVGMLGGSRRVDVAREREWRVELDPLVPAIETEPAPAPASARRSFGARLVFASAVVALFVCGGALTAFGGDQVARLVGGNHVQATPRVTHVATTTSEAHRWHVSHR